jgi:hypothetical protein
MEELTPACTFADVDYNDTDGRSWWETGQVDAGSSPTALVPVPTQLPWKHIAAVRALASSPASLSTLTDRVHLQRSLLLATAAASPLTPAYGLGPCLAYATQRLSYMGPCWRLAVGNTTVMQAARCSLQAWIDADYQNSNWWWVGRSFPEYLSG